MTSPTDADTFRILAGVTTATLPGLYPPDAANKARYEADMKARGAG